MSWDRFGSQIDVERDAERGAIGFKIGILDNRSKEFSGGHDWLGWRRTLAEELIFLKGTAQGMQTQNRTWRSHGGEILELASVGWLWTQHWGVGGLCFLGE
jgi:hypothetical protein